MVLVCRGWRRGRDNDTVGSRSADTVSSLRARRHDWQFHDGTYSTLLRFKISLPVVSMESCNALRNDLFDLRFAVRLSLFSYTSLRFLALSTTMTCQDFWRLSRMGTFHKTHASMGTPTLIPS